MDDLRQLLQLHRLVELHTVLLRDIAQGVGRDVTGQNDDRDLAMKLFPQLRGDLEPVHAIRQIVVCEDEVRSDRPSRRPIPAPRCRQAPLPRDGPSSLRTKFEKFAHFGIVLDDQDRASAVNAFSRSRHPCRADGAQAAVPLRSVGA